MIQIFAQNFNEILCSDIGKIMLISQLLRLLEYFSSIDKIVEKLVRALQAEKKCFEKIFIRSRVMNYYC